MPRSRWQPPPAPCSVGQLRAPDPTRAGARTSPAAPPCPQRVRTRGTTKYRALTPYLWQSTHKNSELLINQSEPKYLARYPRVRATGMGVPELGRSTSSRAVSAPEGQPQSDGALPSHRWDRVPGPGSLGLAQGPWVASGSSAPRAFAGCTSQVSWGDPCSAVSSTLAK